MADRERETRLFAAYRDFFAAGEEHRRWNVDRDIPWAEASGAVSDVVVGVVESFLAVEAYLPDYVRTTLDIVRSSRGRAWFQASWGYEESKHSLALELWLLRAKKRSEAELADFLDLCLSKPYALPEGTPRRVLAYQMIQELATAVNYRRLRELVTDDRALSEALRLIMIDERAHYQFFRDAYALLLEEDRDAAIDDLHHVLARFEMPAHALIPEFDRRGREIEAAKIFNGKVFVKEVVAPIYRQLGVPSHAEIRARASGGNS